MKMKQQKQSDKRKEDVVNKNAFTTQPQEMAETNGEVKDVIKSLKNVEKTIFEHFNELTNEEEQPRIDASWHLIQQLSKTKEPEKRKKEIAYTLKRLVRGCGASTNTSRAGFFTGLVAFLKIFQSDNELSMEEIFTIMQKELHVGATIGNKEDADAVIGKILVCAALLHSEMCKKADDEQLEKIVNEFIISSHHRSYHTSLSYSFLIELIETLNVKQFEASVWPLLQKELQKPWTKHTIQTVHCLIFVKEKFPTILNAKYMKNHFGGIELLNNESFAHLHKIFWNHSNTAIVLHPGFELFGTYIASCSKLAEFWTQTVDPALKSPTKLLEITTLKIVSDILNNLNLEKTNMEDLLSANCMKFIVEGLKGVKQKKDETLTAFYTEFFDALTACYSKLQDDMRRVAVIKRLILPPGTFNIEKYTQTRIIHQLINTLGENGVKDMFSLYKNIFMDRIAKNTENSSEVWLNFERMNAGYMLQHLLSHKSVQLAYQWRKEQLIFLLTAGIFYTTDSLESCKKEAACTFSKDFGEQCKSMFYTSLQMKMHDLREEKNLLLQLVASCNEHLLIKNATKHMRLKTFNEKSLKSWQAMYEIVSTESAKAKTDHMKKKTLSGRNNSQKAAKESHEKLELIFHILLLNMGLQLFREPEMAAPAIGDLLKCMERISNTTRIANSAIKIKSTAQNDNGDEEPQWIEVVIDLFLHLLSQNASALRNIVNSLFPHFCANLNLNAVHQILSVLDMKDGNNPLSTKSDAINEEDDSNDDEEEATEDLKNGNAAANYDDSDEESNSDDDDEDDDDDEEEDDDGEEEVTATDKLRNAISQALIENGGSGNTYDDDMESIDLNDLTEEDGKKLDEALANAFKAMKKSSSHQNSAQNKKSKSYHVQLTTVMHFRIRVLDLIEIYLQQEPTLLISIEIMLALYEMIEYCVIDELKPLQSKVEKVLNKLTTQKGYPIDDDLSEKSLINFIRLIVEKKTTNAAYEITNRLRNKCIVFLMNAVCKVDKDRTLAITNSSPESSVLSLCIEYVQDFVKSRNPLVNITLLSEILKLRWLGVWLLTAALVEEANSTQIRTFRRIQIYEIFLTIYKNIDLQRLDVDATKRTFKLIEKSLASRLQTLTILESEKQSSKEFQTLLELLLQIHRIHQRMQWQSELWNENMFTAVQRIRSLVRLDTAQMYQRFCATFKLIPIRNIDVQTIKSTVKNGSADGGHSSDSDAKEEHTKYVTAISASKRKIDCLDVRKQKKLKKLKRLEIASQGLNSGVPFGQRQKHGHEDDNR